jgi:Domain of unknown function (DUF5122) beta-propeller
VSNLAALDANGNAIASWTPAANYAVKVLAADGTDILVGGAFTQIDGTSKLHLALISPTGSLVSFKGHTNKEVDALAVASGTVYAGGLFTKANGSVRNFLAAFSSSTGALGSWAPSADARVDAILADTSQVIVGGFFTHIDGKSAAHLQALDPTTGAPTTWAAHASAAVLALTEDTGSVYAGIGGKGGMVAAYAASGGGLLWQDQTDGNVQAITTAAGEVIPAGHFNNFCDLNTDCANPITRHKIAALNETTGALDPTWHPSINSSLGVFAALGTATSLQIGGDFTKVAGVAQAHYAEFLAS